MQLFTEKQFMKIPTLLMASLVTVSLSAQTTKPVAKKGKKVVKKVKTAETPKAQPAQSIAKKDTVIRRSGYCPACGMG